MKSVKQYIRDDSGTVPCFLLLHFTGDEHAQRSLYDISLYRLPTKEISSACTTAGSSRGETELACMFLRYEMILTLTPKHK